MPSHPLCTVARGGAATPARELCMRRIWWRVFWITFWVLLLLVFGVLLFRPKAHDPQISMTVRSAALDGPKIAAAANRACHIGGIRGLLHKGPDAVVVRVTYTDFGTHTTYNFPCHGD